MFGIGGSKQKATSESTAFGQSGSESLSESISGSQSTQGSQATSGQDIAFKDLFAKLYGGAATAAGGISGKGVQSSADMLFSGGTKFLDQLQQGGVADRFMENRLTGNDGLLDENIAGLKSDLGSFFRDELNPAISSQAAGGGTLGGGRQGVAQGLAVGKVAEQFQRGSTALRSADVQARDAVAANLAGNRTQAAQTGLGALPGLLGVKQTGSLAGLAPYQALAGILGGPTVLGKSQSTSFGESTSDSVARAVSESFSEDYSTSKSKSKGKSGSIGF